MEYTATVFCNVVYFYENTSTSIHSKKCKYVQVYITPINNTNQLLRNFYTYNLVF